MRWKQIRTPRTPSQPGSKSFSCTKNFLNLFDRPMVEGQLGTQAEHRSIVGSPENGTTRAFVS